MSLLAVVLILLFWAGCGIFEALKPKSNINYTPETLKKMTGEMIGKSKKECRQILKKYEKQSINKEFENKDK